MAHILSDYVTSLSSRQIRRPQAFISLFTRMAFSYHDGLCPSVLVRVQEPAHAVPESQDVVVDCVQVADAGLATELSEGLGQRLHARETAQVELHRGNQTVEIGRAHV